MTYVSKFQPFWDSGWVWWIADSELQTLRQSLSLKLRLRKFSEYEFPKSESQIKVWVWVWDSEMLVNMGPGEQDWWFLLCKLLINLLIWTNKQCAYISKVNIQYNWHIGNTLESVGTAFGTKTMRIKRLRVWSSLEQRVLISFFPRFFIITTTLKYK